MHNWAGAEVPYLQQTYLFLNGVAAHICVRDVGRVVLDDRSLLLENPFQIETLFVLDKKVTVEEVKHIGYAFPLFLVLDVDTAVLGEGEAFLEEEYLQRSAFVDFSHNLSCHAKSHGRFSLCQCFNRIGTEGGEL